MSQAEQIQKLTSTPAYRPAIISYPLSTAFIFAAVFVAVFGLYFFTLAPGVTGGDAGEHQFAVPILGIPHTTGYPLYLLAGKLWTLLIPVGSMAWRMNLFSAFGGALAAGVSALVVYHLSKEIFNSPLWAGAIVTGLTLAFGLTLWQWSVIAGVRSFNVFFFALLTLEAIVWSQQRKQEQSNYEIQNPKPETQNPKPETRNPKPETQNPKPETQNPKPETQNYASEIQNSAKGTQAKFKTQNSKLKTQNSKLTLRWLAFTVGLSLAHHRTTIFYLPSLIGWVWWHERRLIRQPRRILTLILLAMAPLLLYIFIYLRGINNPPYTHEPIYDFQSFWFLVGSGDSTGLFLSIDPAFLPARLAFIWSDILNQLSWPGVILAALGGLTLLWKAPIHFIFQGLLVAILVFFVLDFEVVNLNEAPTWYLMPAYFIFAVWVGIAVNRIISIINYQLSIINYQLTQPFIAALVLILLTISLARPNWQTQRAAATAPLDDWRQLLRGTQAQRFVESSLPYVKPNSIIWGDWEQYTPIQYYQLIHGQRPDITVLNPLDNWPDKVKKSRAIGQPIYFARKTSDLIGTPYLSMTGPLIYLGSEPDFNIPADITRINANFEDELELVGYRAKLFAQDKQAGTILQLMLYWRAPRKVAWDYALSLRLLNAAGQEIYKKDVAHPVLSSYPTTLWTPGEVVGDFYELPLSPDAGPLTIHLLPYRTEGPGVWHNLKLNGSDTPQEGIYLGPFESR